MSCTAILTAGAALTLGQAGECGGFPRPHKRSKAVSGRGLAGVLQDGLLPPRVQPRRLQGGRAGVPRGWRTPREHTHATGTEAHPDAPGGRHRRRPSHIIRRSSRHRHRSHRRCQHHPHHVRHCDRLHRRHHSHRLGPRRHPSWSLCVVQKLRLGSGISDGDFWIGLRRADHDERHPSDGVTPCPQRYRWTDGSAAAFREWHSDEPSCGAESCVVMYHQPGVGGAYLYQWNDDRCSMKHNFICKYQPERRPEEERGTTAAGQGAETTPDGNHVTLTGTSGPLALYILLPAVPLLLILAAAAARYRHALGKRSAVWSGTERHPCGSSHSPAARRGHLWISETHKGGGVWQAI